MNMNDKHFINEYYEYLMKGLQDIKVTLGDGASTDIQDGFDLCCDKIRSIRKAEGTVYFCGNGASATMAEHMSADWFKNGGVNTYSFSEIASLTAISNDIDYSQVFSYRLERVNPKDSLIVGISSSGNSPNIVNALSTAKRKGMYTVSISGMKPDNRIRLIGDVNFYVPLDTYGLVESAHAILLHMMLDYFKSTDDTEIDN